jgi:hypothetical protein
MAALGITFTPFAAIRYRVRSLNGAAVRDFVRRHVGKPNRENYREVIRVRGFNLAISRALATYIHLAPVTRFPILLAFTHAFASNTGSVRQLASGVYVIDPSLSKLHSRRPADLNTVIVCPSVGPYRMFRILALTW